MRQRQSQAWAQYPSEDKSLRGAERATMNKTVHADLKNLNAGKIIEAYRTVCKNDSFTDHAVVWSVAASLVRYAKAGSPDISLYYQSVAQYRAAEGRNQAEVAVAVRWSQWLTQHMDRNDCPRTIQAQEILVSRVWMGLQVQRNPELYQEALDRIYPM